MGMRRWLAWLGRGALAGAGETDYTSFSTTPKPIDQLFAEMRNSTGSVTREQALSVPAVQKGRNLICSIATLPIVQLDPRNNPVTPSMFDQIDPDVPNVVTLAQTIEDLMMEAISWWRVTGFWADGYPATARRLEPGSVSIDPPMGQSPAPLPSGMDPRDKVVYVDGKPVSAREIIRFDSPNPAVLTVAARSIRRAIRYDESAGRYADDPRPLDYFAPADGVDPLDDDEVSEILAKWRMWRRKRTTGYVPASLKHVTVDQPSPADLQLVELQQKATLDVANALGVDPEELGVSTTSRTYANDVDRRQDRINDVLAPYMRAITDRLSMGDVTRRGYRVTFLLDDYLKSNPTERWAVYEKGVAMGVWTVDDIRQKEREPERATNPATEPTAPAATEPASVDASRLRVVSFAQPRTYEFTFAGDGQPFEFNVDTEKRTITGLAVPYGKIGIKYGLRFRFRKGSLQYTETSRVKHFKDHHTPVGRALELKDSRAGLLAKLSVGAGPTGDELLQLAQDEVYDGLSVGVEFNLDPDAGDVVLARDGVYDVLRADLREISTTAMPAFDDARVTSVAASRYGGNPMLCTTCGHEHAPNVACNHPPMAQPPVQFQWNGQQPAQQQPAQQQQQPGAQQFADAFAAMLAGGGLQQIPLQQGAPNGPPPADDKPQVVNPTRLTASTQVVEPPAYRVDRKGNIHKGSHDFSTDIITGLRGDQGAYDRALSWIQGAFDIASGDVNELNPTRQRPDMYVDQKDFQYPVWESINKGTLTDITPFTFPKFNAAAGLVGNHTEGVEPTSGTMTTTGQTVTPTAVSGKAKITRETWDQGGNPQVSNLIWRQMQKGWFEALEAAAVALLDAASPTQITLTAGAADSVLDQEITQAFAALQFIRGGFSMDSGFTQIDLYKKLVAAKDSDGRRLYPAIGPTNALGTVSQRFSAIDINGVTMLPAWALAATGSVVASSYIFDSADVHGWASVPQRLEFNIEVAHVYLGIWGYKATAISDITGVRELLYDPVA